MNGTKEPISIEYTEGRVCVKSFFVYCYLDSKHNLNVSPQAVPAIVAPTPPPRPMIPPEVLQFDRFVGRWNKINFGGDNIYPYYYL